MGTRWLFWLLAFGVFGTLTASGFIFFRDSTTQLLAIQAAALFTAILLLIIYHRLIKPHRVMLMGIDLIRGKDFSSRLRRVKSKETNRVIDTFNQMMLELRKERLSAQEKNYFLELLLEASAQGVIILDFDERISSINRVGAQLLGAKESARMTQSGEPAHTTQSDKSASLVGKAFSEFDTELAAVLASLREGNDQIVRIFGHSLYRCMRSSFVDRGFNRSFILIEEMTHELMRIEKESYERVIRMMAHEVNNSISGIGVTLDVVAEILAKSDTPENAEVLQAVNASSERCRHIGKFIAHLADVVRIPPPTLNELSLGELLRSVDAFNRIECRNRNIDLLLSLPPKALTIRADGIQMEQVLNNIIKNAYESIGQNGSIQISVSENPLTISVTDNGPGISPKVRDKLFTPFFTTKSSGQGVGLTLIREVLFNHRFQFSFTTENGLTTFRIHCEAQSKTDV